MENLEGRIAYLPDGQKVRIESVEDGYATCRRIGGEWDGRIAVCAVSSLRIERSCFSLTSRFAFLNISPPRIRSGYFACSTIH